MVDQHGKAGPGRQFDWGRARRLLALALYLAAASALQVGARTEFRLGGADGNAWRVLLEEGGTGVYLVFDEVEQALPSVSVRTTPHGAGIDTLVDFSGTSIQPRYFDPLVNIALTDPEGPANQIPLPYTGGIISGGAPENPNIKKMLDGDPQTAHFRRFSQDPNSRPGIGQGWACGCLFDFAADVPVNRVRFYPRLGQEDDQLLIEKLAAPTVPAESFFAESFADNYVAWYELSTRSMAQAQQSGGFELLQSNRENLDAVIDLRFKTRSIRWLLFRTFPLRNWEVAEFEVYGEGFVEKAVYIGQILDFGQTVNWGKIRWSGEAPEGTRVEIRTRTGQSPDPSLYFAATINGDTVPISKEEYLGIPRDARLPTVYDTDNWSFWSPSYDFAAGRRDGTRAAAWADGTPLLSPGPSRYIQIAVRFFSTFTTAPRLDQLSLQFGRDPAAREVVGEIWPIEVDSFEPATFTYLVRPTFDGRNRGFDRLEILTHNRPEVRSLVIDGRAVPLQEGGGEEAFPVQIMDDRAVLAFPKLAGTAGSQKLIEAVFEVPVLRFGAQFSSWVFDSDDPDQIKQRVEPGNASFRFSGNILGVRAPIGGPLIAGLQVAPRVFTPNGDGVNEAVVISYKLREVTVDRLVSIRIFDLAGVEVAQLAPLVARSGVFERGWDGRDEEGRLVRPGIYMYRLALESGKGEKVGFIAVAY